MTTLKNCPALFDGQQLSGVWNEGIEGNPKITAMPAYLLLQIQKAFVIK